LLVKCWWNWLQVDIKTKSSIRKVEKVIARIEEKNIPILAGLKRGQTALLILCNKEKVFTDSGLFISTEFSLLDSKVLTNIDELILTIEESAFSNVTVSKDSVKEAFGPIAFDKPIVKDGQSLQAIHKYVKFLEY